MSESTTMNIMALTANDFVLQYTPLVKRIAYHLASRLPSHVLADDMIQAGMEGLLEARAHFDDSKGAAFETYASIRIRGAMLDELRRGDWAPRSVHRAARDISEVIRKLEHELGREAKDAEVAEALNMTVQEYHHLLMDAACVKVSAYQDGGLTEDNMRDGLFSRLGAPHEVLASVGFKRALAQHIADLPERERLVISMYYQDELNLKEIGAVLGVSESRVCQIHSSAVIRLRARMTEWE